MEQLIFGALAAFAALAIIRGLLPFRIPGWLNPVLLVLLAYGVLSIPDRRVLLALACSTLAAVIYQLGLSDLPAPWKLHLRLTLPRREPPVTDVPQAVRPGGRAGRRIPRL
jgi:hypothetical protein